MNATAGLQIFIFSFSVCFFFVGFFFSFLLSAFSASASGRGRAGFVSAAPGAQFVFMGSLTNQTGKVNY